MRPTPVACLMLALVAAVPVAADAKTALQIAALSARTYSLGQDSGDALLMITAARLRKSLALQPTDRAPVDGAGATDTLLTWEEMLTAAETLAAGDPTLLGLIADTRAETDKGVAFGPVYNIGSLETGADDTYPPMEFRGGEYAEVYVEAKTATDLNLVVRDSEGRLVCSDTDISPIAYCGWTPAEAGAFTVTVENRGPEAAPYALMTN